MTIKESTSLRRGNRHRPEMPLARPLPRSRTLQVRRPVLYTKPLFSWRKALLTSTDKKDLLRFRPSRPPKPRRPPPRTPKVILRFSSGRRPASQFPRQKAYPLYLPVGRTPRGFTPLPSSLRSPPPSLLGKLLRLPSPGLRPRPLPAQIAAHLAAAHSSLFVAKRDISSYFPSVDQNLLLRQLEHMVEPGDYLYQLLEQRVRFQFEENGAIHTAVRGIPFGTPIACSLPIFISLPSTANSIPSHPCATSATLMISCSSPNKRKP